MALDARTYFNKVKLGNFRLSTPPDNPLIESCNGNFREECLDVNWLFRWRMLKK